MTQDINSELLATGADTDDLIDEKFELQFDGLKANQLRTTLYRNDIRNSDTRTDVTGHDGHLLWGGTYTIHIACRKQKLRFGTFEGSSMFYSHPFPASLSPFIFYSPNLKLRASEMESYLERGY